MPNSVHLFMKLFLLQCGQQSVKEVGKGVDTKELGHAKERFKVSGEMK